MNYRIKKREDESVEQYLVRRYKRHQKKLKGRCSIAETEKLWSALNELEEILEGLGIKVGEY